MSFPHVRSDHHSYNDELESLDKNTTIITDDSDNTILLTNEATTRELDQFLMSRMDSATGERLKKLHNISVGLKDRFAFDYGSGIKLSLLRDRVRIHPDEWNRRTTHDIKNEEAWNELIQTVVDEW